MSNVSAMLQHIDTLVLDYIERRPTGILQETVPGRKNGTKRPGLTLEELYCHYFRRKLPTLDDEVHIEKTELSVNEAEPNCRNLPNIPTEIIDQIMKYCSVDTLLYFRVLSRRLNILSSENLRRCKRNPICLPDFGDRFLSTFERSIPTLGHPLSTYVFSQISPEALRIVDLVGAQIRFAESWHTSEILQVVHKMPNLVSLYIMGIPKLPDLVTATRPQLLYLRSLKLCEDESIPNVDDILESLQTWLEIAPYLQGIWIRSYSRGEKDVLLELSGLICSHKQLKKISVNGTSIEMYQDRMVNLKLGDDTVRVPDYNPFKFLCAQSIQCLSIPQELVQTHFPSLPNVRNLTLRIGSFKSIISNAILPGHFPALQHVTLESYLIQKGFFQSYRYVVFPGVSSLRVNGGHWEWPNDDQPIFHIVFPALKSLSLGGFLGRNYANYFSNNFPAISNLNFFDFDSNLKTLTRLSDYGEEVGLFWPFSNLKNVRSMEFETRNNELPVVMDILSLTLSNSLPPLDTLALRAVSRVPLLHCDRTQLNKARDLFYSMRQLTYHKSLKFQCIKKDRTWGYE